MKFDRNTVLGFVILALLFFGYFYFTNKEQAAYNKQKAEKARLEQRVKDSINLVNKPLEDSLNRVTDSVNKQQVTGIFQDTAAAPATGQLVTVENNLMRMTFDTKGGQVKKVELKNYKSPDSSIVKIGGTDFDKLSYTINTGTNLTAQTDELVFQKVDSVQNPDGSKTISFSLQSPDKGAAIVHEYILKPDNYMVDLNLRFTGANQLLSQGNLNLLWQYTAHQQESDISYEKQNTQVGYVEDGSFDYHTIGRKSSKEFDESVNWVGVRQRFFFTILVAKNNFSSGRMEWTVPPDTARTVVRSIANMKIQVPAGSTSQVPLAIYYGPSDYHILKSYNMRFEKLVNLGQGIYAFVRPINKFLIMPIFDFLKTISGSSMGLAIALLTIFIKIITSPLLYKSYLSGAKMKLLRPEIAKLKEKFGEDRQAMSMEQMKLFREAGVNPLGGCLPALLQIPIFFALFSLFNSDIALRGAEFLWSPDLAAYDAPIHFGFNIPLLGSHLSLFNLAACATSFLISWYSISMTPDQSNPVMKYMPYIFPIFLLFFFNKLPSALTWYYTVSNVVTLAIQFVIQHYIIDHDKIMAKIEENRKKPKTKSKWAERMEQMQEQQKKMKDMQAKARKR